MVRSEQSVYELTVDTTEVGQRVDAWITGRLSSVTRSFIQKLLVEGQVQVNHQKIRANYRVKEGDRIRVEIPTPRELAIKPQTIPLDIVYEDPDVLVINKPVGLVVHPAQGNQDGTLVNALLAYCQDLSGIGGVYRPGIVHRLDKDTTGLMVVAKNDPAHQDLSIQLKNREVQRGYLALVHGGFAEKKGRIEAPIGRHPRERKKMAVVARNGKSAITRYEILETFGSYTLLKVQLETGRTHQIRVHFAYLGHPVVGDPVYGRRKGNLEQETQLLHASTLRFSQPQTRESLAFSAPLPTNFFQVLALLRS